MTNTWNTPLALAVIAVLLALFNLFTGTMVLNGVWLVSVVLIFFSMFLMAAEADQPPEQY